jgi:SAM-dependent methyltransferase
MARLEHDDVIVDQFTKTAEAFAAAGPVHDAGALAILVGEARPQPADAMLDVACGPGFVVGAFAPLVAHATGIDVTPAMIEIARRVDAPNADFRVGDVRTMPFADASFDIVTCRYAFHHLESPFAVMREMARVCRPGGRVLVADVVVADDAAVAAAFNAMEKARDPSHVRALAERELYDLFTRAGLPEPQAARYLFPANVDAALAASAPDGGAAEVRRLFDEAIASGHGLGTNARHDGTTIRFDYPILVLTATKE